MDIPSPPGAPKGYRERRSQCQGTKRRNRDARVGGKKKFNIHECAGTCSRATDWDAQVTKSLQQGKSWFQKYAEVQLVEMGAASREVNEVPGLGRDENFETVAVTVDSGACNAVGPPNVGTYFDNADAEASKAGKHYSAANGSLM